MLYNYRDNNSVRVRCSTPVSTEYDFSDSCGCKKAAEVAAPVTVTVESYPNGACCQIRRRRLMCLLCPFRRRCGR